MEGRKKLESVILITKTFSSRISVSNPTRFGRSNGFFLCVHGRSYVCLGTAGAVELGLLNFYSGLAIGL